MFHKFHITFIALFFGLIFLAITSPIRTLLADSDKQIEARLTEIILQRVPRYVASRQPSARNSRSPSSRRMPVVPTYRTSRRAQRSQCAALHKAATNAFSRRILAIRRETDDENQNGNGQVAEHRPLPRSTQTPLLLNNGQKRTSRRPWHDRSRDPRRKRLGTLQRYDESRYGELDLIGLVTLACASKSHLQKAATLHEARLC